MRIMWVDDDWNEQSESRIILCDLLEQLEAALINKCQLAVSWELIASAGDAYTKIDDSESKYDFVIIDYEFKNAEGEIQEISVDRLHKKLEERCIYNLLLTNYVQNSRSRNNKYCFGAYEKSGQRFIEDIVYFFSCPPFRIIQISDIHYNSIENLDDQEQYIESLHNQLRKIQCEKNSDFLIIAGDLAASNPAVELSLMTSVLNYILMDTNIKKERILIVPGNHEIVWSDFKNNKRERSPYSSFVSFLQTFYTKESVYSQLVEQNIYNSGSLSVNCSEDDLTWLSRFPNLGVSIIGICSNSSELSEQGKGVLSQSNIRYIRDVWGEEKPSNETRILVLHHNIFPTRSLFSEDEQRTIANAGTALDVLTSCGCDIVMSGHTHRAEILIYQSSVMDHNGYSELDPPMIVLASGTSGGVSPTHDFPRNFNVVDISRNIHTRSKRVHVNPHIYNSRNNSWRIGKGTSFEL